MNPPRPIPHSKEALRSQLRSRLDAQPTEEIGVANAAIIERVLAVPEVLGARRIFSCLSFGHEVNTWSLISRLLGEGKEIFVPRSNPIEKRLHVHRFPCPLETRSFGLREPTPGTPELAPDHISNTLDVALILGLGYDAKGFRLGYGAGYFDRFLAKRPFPTLALAYDCQVVSDLPNEPHDIPMTAIVTQSRVLRPTL